MPFTIQQLAEWIGGNVSGDGSTVIHRLLPLAEAQAGDLSLVDGEKYIKTWATSPASAAVVAPNFPADNRPLIRVENPFAAFQSLLLRIRGERTATREIHASAAIHQTVQVGANASIGPFVAIGEGTVIGANATIHAGVVIGRFCQIGDDVILYPHATLYDNMILGHRVILQAGAVIGADGFGFKFVNGRHEKVPQIGTVILEDDVEIGANCTISRATLGSTRIGRGTKMDNLVMVAHNCQIGPHNILISLVAIAGSSTTGEYVVIAGQAGVKDHVNIGAGAMIGAQCGIMSDVPAGARMLGSPGMPATEYMTCVAHWRKLPEMRRDLAKLKKASGGEPA